MKKLSTAIPGLLVWSILLPSALAEETVHREDIRKTLTFSAATGQRKRLVVDNISGSISVVGTGASSVELVAHETIRAGSEDRARVAKEEVQLVISEEPGRILICVKTPWRCRDGSIHSRDRDYDDYDVRYDFELSVPFATDLHLKTVNDGGISVKNVDGLFEVENVNGGLTMSGIGGSGTFSTVNGDVSVAFAKNPDSRSSFRTVNGRVDAGFTDDLSADLRLKTFNGDVYTDFIVTDLPSNSFTQNRRERTKVYRSSDSFRVRIGRGGPELSFDTLNGNIYIVKNKQ